MDNVLLKLLNGIRQCPSGDIVSQADLARLSGVSKNTVNKYIAVFVYEPAFAELVEVKKYGNRKLLVIK